MGVEILKEPLDLVGWLLSCTYVATVALAFALLCSSVC